MIEFGKTKVAIVCGGRTYGEVSANNPDWIWQRLRLYDVLDKAVDRLGIEAIVTGAQKGADYYAWYWAQARSIPCGSFPADWKTLGPKAGPIRNQKMLDEAKPFCVIAFPGGPGTADMVNRAQKAGLPVYLIP